MGNRAMPISLRPAEVSIKPSRNKVFMYLWVFEAGSLWAVWWTPWFLGKAGYRVTAFLENCQPDGDP